MFERKEIHNILSKILVGCPVAVPNDTFLKVCESIRTYVYMGHVGQTTDITLDAEILASKIYNTIQIFSR